jgi:hypothetical protein
MSTPQYGTREQLAEHLTANGFPTKLSYLHFICAPSSGTTGPPVEHYWGHRPIYNLEKGLAWARNRATAKRKRTQPRTSAA